MKTEPNAPINAIVMVDEDGKHYIDRRNFGLTKREYFAAMALQGYLSNHFDKDFLSAISKTAKQAGVSAGSMIATISVEYADSLIEALNK